jgi:hypothetical protein
VTGGVDQEGLRGAALKKRTRSLVGEGAVELFVDDGLKGTLLLTLRAGDDEKVTIEAKGVLMGYKSVHKSSALFMMMNVTDV